MNLLVVGASHQTAPVAVLERLAVAPDQTSAMLGQLLAQTYVCEAVVLSTCNRVEVYTAVSAFHGGLGDVCGTLAQRAGSPASAFGKHLYVHYDEAAVDHAYRVAAGLDSLVVGESQILGQLRDAYHAATAVDAAGRMLHELMQQALRVGKRVHAETEIDRTERNVVSAGLDVAAERLGGPLRGRPALVIGAGSMGGLTLAALARAGASPLSVANRGAGRASGLAGTYQATPVRFDDLAGALSAVDVVVTATASPEPVLSAEAIAGALADRRPEAGPLVILDLAVPRDVEPAAGDLPGVVLVDIDGLVTAQVTPQHLEAVSAAERIISAEAEAFLGWLRGAEVAPTLAALRARGDEVVNAEIRRLVQRRPDLTEDQRAEVAHTMHRIVQQLLHSPSVRVRQLAAEPGGDQYAALLRDLFDLDVPKPRQVSEVTDIEVRS